MQSAKSDQTDFCNLLSNWKLYAHAHTNRNSTGENPNPWNSENQTLCFLPFFFVSVFFSSSFCSDKRSVEYRRNRINVAKHINRKQQQRQQNLRKERKNRTSWPGLSTHNNITIASLLFVVFQSENITWSPRLKYNTHWKGNEQHTHTLTRTHTIRLGKRKSTKYVHAKPMHSRDTPHSHREMARQMCDRRVVTPAGVRIHSKWWWHAVKRKTKPNEIKRHLESHKKKKTTLMRTATTPSIPTKTTTAKM